MIRGITEIVQVQVGQKFPTKDGSKNERVCSNSVAIGSTKY